MGTIYKIHPAIGIARLGTAPADSHFVGPEIPGRSTEFDQQAFRVNGMILPQGARFRVFAYDTESPQTAPQEIAIGGDIIAIDWMVHLANKKANWFKFDGRVGETSPDVPAGEVRLYPPKSLRNFRSGESDTARRKRLVIDPRAHTLTANGTAQTVAVDKRTSDQPAAESWPGPFSDGREIQRLGQLFVDASGRLTVVGGQGISGTTVAGSPLHSYANNDNWFDDVSDGPVTATIRFKNDQPQTATAGWVIVRAPRFAPSVKCVVTMYDAVYDVAVRHHNLAPALFDPAAKAFRTDYAPSFTDEVYPILRAAELVGWLFAQIPGGSNVKGRHAWNHQNLGRLPFPGGNPSPSTILQRLRTPSDWNNSSTDTKMPLLHGDEGENESFLTLTQTQYHIMSQWRAGVFKSGGVPTTPPATTSITATGLDRAALENCVGGAFFPGIEAGWIMRDPRTFEPLDPFRIQVLPNGQESNPDGLTPGGATMRSALPWQADFNDCADMWWPSHRPTDVLENVGDPEPARWASGIDDQPTDEKRHLAMVVQWAMLRFVRSTTGDGNPPFVQSE